MNGLHEWMEARLAEHKTEPNSGLGKAIYAFPAASQRAAPTPAGRAMAGLMAILDEFEREILRERTRAGLAHARENGKRLGRRQLRRHMLRKSGNYTARAAAKRRSPDA
jgi:DNA invertase Pin-like site-specific DNA recombinase